MRLNEVYIFFLTLLLLLSVCDCQDEPLGTGVSNERDVMDNCTGAAGPRPITDVFSPGRTDFATIDDVNGGYCGVEINTPGIWWWVNGTGEIIRVGTCHINTNIKVKISIFTGSCGDLRCVTGHSRPDYECALFPKKPDNNEWDTIATAVDFPTFEGQHYFILAHEDDSGPGNIWMSFRHPVIPLNNECVDAIGPVPRDLTPIPSTTIDATISEIPVGYCGEGQIPGLYPGVWFQVMGTGGPVSVMACGSENYDGFYFSTYHGPDCDSLKCVSGSYDINVEDPDKCTFGRAGVPRPMTKFTFNTRDRDRYYVYVHFARTQADRPTSDFRFFADDGARGAAGSSGPHLIKFEESTLKLTGAEGISDKGDESSATTTTLQNTVHVLVVAATSVLLAASL
ncbi:hypothetical protein IV203_035285 [Nitzschia inconspicua]|uniref:Uncharacterized protein n=1 Tax=Nitzschia inconspicua TaxID=303405 RepID=A0A9K3LFX9_9STRA|nr:hypothetical protein IV203_035285 [Nitzschia inconspicua]